MLDLRRLLTPEAAVRLQETEEWHRRRKGEYAAMSDDSLVASARYCLAQMTPTNWAPGEPVYDATMWHVILPELMRRVEQRGGLE